MMLVTLLFMKYQTTFIYCQLNLVTKHIAIISSMRIRRYLQYVCFFISSSGSMVWYILIFPSLSNSSKMRSHLETSKVNINSFYRPLLVGLSDVQEKDLSSECHTNSAL
jgi:hypothetical protein